MTLPEIEKYILSKEEAAALWSAVSAAMESKRPKDGEELSLVCALADIAYLAQLDSAFKKTLGLQKELLIGIKEFNEREENKNA